MAGLPHRSDRIVVMGVLNVTPDSFSDGGRWADLDGALLLADDPFTGLEWQAGHLTRPQESGWGVRRA